MTTPVAPIHNPEQDNEDIVLAHQYRLSLSTKPSQSSFRVLALLFYEVDPVQGTSKKPFSTIAPWLAHSSHGRSYVVGTNDEPGFMGGAICAERAAMVQLRFVPGVRITKLVIATDSVDPISPGMLCREFLAGHDSVPWDLTVVCGGCGCTQCRLKDDDLLHHLPDSTTTLGTCSGGTQDSEHTMRTLHRTLRELYPYPSPYTRLTATESEKLGDAFRNRHGEDTLDEQSLKLLQLAMKEAQDASSELHPIQFGAAVLFSDGSTASSHQTSALEYGCSLDAVSQLATAMTKRTAKAILLVQVDQYGIGHAPFAPARAFLTEQGFGECGILVHETGVDVWKTEEYRWKRLGVSELAPDPPSWTEGTER